MSCVCVCIIFGAIVSRQDFYCTHFALLSECNQIVHITKDLASYVLCLHTNTHSVRSTLYTYFRITLFAKKQGAHAQVVSHIYLFILIVC